MSLLARSLTRACVCDACSACQVCNRLELLARETIGQAAWRARQVTLQFNRLDGASVSSARDAIAPILAGLGSDGATAFPALKSIKLGSDELSLSQLCTASRVDIDFEDEEESATDGNLELIRLIAPILATNKVLSSVDCYLTSDDDDGWRWPYQQLCGREHSNNDFGQTLAEVSLNEVEITRADACIIGQSAF